VSAFDTRFHSKPGKPLSRAFQICLIFGYWSNIHEDIGKQSFYNQTFAKLFAKLFGKHLIPKGKNLKTSTKTYIHKNIFNT
jgi:hypothetical protein